jgi:hypothetical protein
MQVIFQYIKPTSNAFSVCGFHCLCAHVALILVIHTFSNAFSWKYILSFSLFVRFAQLTMHGIIGYE